MRVSAEENEIRMALHRKGKSDADIGRARGCHANAIRDWRLSRQLPANNKSSKHTPAQRAAR